MIEEKTVLILGAGASAPYGYPTGDKLRIDIIESFDLLYERDVVPGLKKYGTSAFMQSRLNFSNSRRKEFISTFKESRIQIDLFINKNRNFFEDLGKLAIILLLFEAERQTNHFWKAEIEGKEDWYRYLYLKMMSDLNGRDDYTISRNDISFITFNYDRSLEEFLFSSLENSHNSIEPDVIQKEMRKVKFHHVYGQLADLPWQNDSEGLRYYPPNIIDYSKRIKNIKVIFDDRLKSSSLTDIHRKIKQAKRIFFLGFGFLNENMKLLGFPEILNPNQKIFGTGKGYTEKERIGIRNRYFNTIKDIENNVFIRDLNCKDLLREYL